MVGDVREKFVVKISICKVLELDGVDSMDKPLEEIFVEISTMESTISIISEAIERALKSTFSFLQIGE